MKKKVLVAGPTTESRVKGKMDIEARWKDVEVQTASFEHVIGLCEKTTPSVVFVCPGAGSPVVIDQIKKMIPGQVIVRVDYDPMPATI